MPLFYGNSNKMQTRVQLIDARDSQGNRLPKKESFELLRTVLKMQRSDLQMVVMPPMSSHETYKMINSLNNATTLAYGKTSHKVTRQYLDKNDSMIMGASNIDLRPQTKEERQTVNKL